MYKKSFHSNNSLHNTTPNVRVSPTTNTTPPLYTLIHSFKRTNERTHTYIHKQLLLTRRNRDGKRNGKDNKKSGFDFFNNNSLLILLRNPISRIPKKDQSISVPQSFSTNPNLIFSPQFFCSYGI